MSAKPTEVLKLADGGSVEVIANDPANGLVSLRTRSPLYMTPAEASFLAAALEKVAREARRA